MAASASTQSSPTMQPHTSGRVAILQAVAKIIAAPSFLIMLSVFLNYSNLCSFERQKEILWGNGGGGGPVVDTRKSDEKPHQQNPGTDKGGKVRQTNEPNPAPAVPPTPHPAPSIVAPKDLTLSHGQEYLHVKVTVTNASEVKFDSNNEALIPAGKLEPARNGNDFKLKLQPVPKQSGEARIKVTATGAGGASEADFTVVVAANRPPAVAIDSPVEFGKSVTTRELKFTVVDELPSSVQVQVKSLTPTILPPGGLRVEGVGKARTLWVTPAAGKWGVAEVELTATDDRNESSTAKVRVTVPTPAFALAKPADVTLKKGEAVPPIPLSVLDEAPAPGKVTFAARVTGKAVKADGVTFENGQLVLPLAKMATGKSSVTVTAMSDDGREAAVSFTVAVELGKGDRVRVAGVVKLTARSEPRENGLAQGTLGSETLLVVDGVEEVNGVRWFLVTWGDRRGWLPAEQVELAE